MMSRRFLLAASRHVVGRCYRYPTSRVFHLRAFSTRPMSLPPNLEIDVRSTCSPYLTNGLVKKDQEEEKQHNDKDVEKDDNDIDEEEDDVVMDDEEDDNDLFVRHDTSNHHRVISLPDRLHVTVYDKVDATPVGTLYLSEQLFGHDTIRVDLLQRTVQYQRNQKRGQRKAKTKTIGEVRGSTAKVRQQKGTGKARAGHSRPAHWRGGAKAHGPKGSIQDYSNCKLNKHVRRLALTHALSQKLKERNVILVNDLQLETHKTKYLTQLLTQWDIGGRHGTSCYILDYDDENYLPVNLTVASQNIYKIKVSNELRANVYDILKHEKLILTVSAVTALEKRLEGLLRY